MTKRSPVGLSFVLTSTTTSCTMAVRRRKSTCRTRSPTSSPQRMPVSMATRIMTRCRCGIASSRRSNSAGERILVGWATALGSSVSAHGLNAINRSRTALRKMLCSRTWYFRIDRGESPAWCAKLTHA